MDIRNIFFAYICLVKSVSASSDTEADTVVAECILENQFFEKVEEKAKKPLTREEPNSVSPVNSELAPLVHEIEKRQRPFECITKRIDGGLLAELMTNPKYQKLVSRCKMKQFQPVCD